MASGRPWTAALAAAIQANTAAVERLTETLKGLTESIPIRSNQT